MKIKIVLATATAISLVLSAGVLGSDNEAGIEQVGNGNIADIDQSGGDSNFAGSFSNPLTQTRNGVNTSPGLYNKLSIEQSGSNNSVGAAGFNQTMTYAFSPASTGYKGVNEIDIKQTSNGNIVGAVSQSTATHMNGNILNITQGGNGGHTVGRVFQGRTQTTVNTASITQEGANNHVALLVQKAGVASSTPNTIVASFTGDNNNSSTWATGSAASASGATFATFIQGREVGASYAYNNSINVDVSGDNNKIGVTQTVISNYAVGNTVGAVEISGDNNELGVYQQGKYNTLALSTISGDYNEIGVRQIGESNEARVDVVTSHNGGANLFSAGSFAGSLGLTAGLISQDGDHNVASLLVVGGDNNAFAIQQDGDGNTANLTQNGGSNQAAISQVGNANNAFAVQVGSFNNLGISQ